MAVVVIQEWPQAETERSTVNYDAISERLAAQDLPLPEGFHAHAAGWTGHGFRIIEIWDSEAEFQQFLQERVMPLVMEISGSGAAQPEVTVNELHHLITR